MTNYSAWSRARLIAKIKFLKPYRSGMHKLARQITPVHNKVKRLEQANAKLKELLNEADIRLNYIEATRVKFHSYLKEKV